MTTPDKSDLDAACERLEAEYVSWAKLAETLRGRGALYEGSAIDSERNASDLRLVLDALKEAERVADAGKRYFQSHYTRWADGGGPNECEHGIAAGIDCLLCDEKTLNGWKDPQ